MGAEIYFLEKIKKATKDEIVGFLTPESKTYIPLSKDQKIDILKSTELFDRIAGFDDNDKIHITILLCLDLFNYNIGQYQTPNSDVTHQTQFDCISFLDYVCKKNQIELTDDNRPLEKDDIIALIKDYCGTNNRSKVDLKGNKVYFDETNFLSVEAITNAINEYIKENDSSIKFEFGSVKDKHKN